MPMGWPELATLLLLTLFIVGPDRLPSVARDAGRALRTLRTTVKGMTDDLKTELGPEFQDVDLRSLHPKTFVTKHLLGDDDDETTLDLIGGTPPSSSGVPLGSGERPPWDPDTT